MRRLLLLGIVTAIGSSQQVPMGSVSPTAAATITWVQSVISSTGCSASTTTNCNVTVASTCGGSCIGNAGIFFAQVGSGSVASVAGCGTWTAGAATAVNFWFYNLNLTAGCTSVTSTVTSGAGRSAGFWEFSPNINNTGWLFDASAWGVNGACNPCIGQALILTGLKDAIVQFISGAATPSAVTSPYTGLMGTTRAAAYAINISTGAAPTWTVSDAAPIIGAIAVKAPH